MSELGTLKALKILQISLDRQIENSERINEPVIQNAVDYTLSQMISLISEITSNHPDLSKLVRVPALPKTRTGASTIFYFNSDLSVFSETAKIIADAQEDIIGSSQPIREDKIFITHGRNLVWRELQSYVEKDLGIPTIELSQQAYGGRSTLQKLKEESDTCRYAIVLMTGDDEMADGTSRARENVIHEIGYFQGKYGTDAVCIVYETGTSIPSNIDGLGRVQFPKDNVKAGFSDLHREIRNFFGK